MAKLIAAIVMLLVSFGVLLLSAWLDDTLVFSGGSMRTAAAVIGALTFSGCLVAVAVLFFGWLGKGR